MLQLTPALRNSLADPAARASLPADTLLPVVSAALHQPLPALALQTLLNWLGEDGGERLSLTWTAVTHGGPTCSLRAVLAACGGEPSVAPLVCHLLHSLLAGGAGAPRRAELVGGAYPWLLPALYGLRDDDPGRGGDVSYWHVAVTEALLDPGGGDDGHQLLCKVWGALSLGTPLEAVDCDAPPLPLPESTRASAKVTSQHVTLLTCVEAVLDASPHTRFAPAIPFLWPVLGGLCDTLLALRGAPPSPLAGVRLKLTFGAAMLVADVLADVRASLGDAGWPPDSDDACAGAMGSVTALLEACTPPPPGGGASPRFPRPTVPPGSRTSHTRLVALSAAGGAAVCAALLREVPPAPLPPALVVMLNQVVMDADLLVVRGLVDTAPGEAQRVLARVTLLGAEAAPELRALGVGKASG